eukprot:symbB.v1.2.039536.t1/scaffold6632.1/size16580/2
MSWTSSPGARRGGARSDSAARKGGGKGKKSEGAQPSKKSTEEVEYLKAVDARWHLNKASLRAYASATGSPGAGQTDSDYLSLSRIFERQEAHTTELMNRLGIALSEAGGTVGMGAELLGKYATDPAAASEKLGVAGVVDLLQTPAGQSFLAAASTFNKHEETSKDAADAAVKWVDFFVEDPKSKSQSCAAHGESCCQAVLAGHGDAAVQKWMRAPSEKGRLVAALVGSYQAQTEVQQKKKQTLSDSELSQSSAKSVGGGGASSSGSAVESSSSSSDDKKHKKKKDKKNAKKKPAKKKDKKKEKKDKDDKKKRKKSSADSEEDDDKKDKNDKKKKKQKSSAGSEADEKNKDKEDEKENS